MLSPFPFPPSPFLFLHFCSFPNWKNKWDKNCRHCGRQQGSRIGEAKCLWRRHRLSCSQYVFLFWILFFYIYIFLIFNFLIDGDIASLSKALKEACPNGIDTYFDNSRGFISEAVYENLNPGARVYVCGTSPFLHFSFPFPFSLSYYFDKHVISFRFSKISTHALFVVPFFPPPSFPCLLTTNRRSISVQQRKSHGTLCWS